MRVAMKAAVIGAGRMGRRHVQCVRDLGLELVGVVDPRRESLAEAAKEYGLDDRSLFESPDAVLALKPEVVIVASTAPGHAPLTVKAAEAGAKYILCEKPMACSLAEADRMIEVCAARGAHLAINHQMRVMDQYTTIREILEAPDFGGWSSITACAGNFGIAMNGSHYFELLRWMAGEAPHEVTAWFDGPPVASPRGAEFSDRAGSVRVSTKSGKRLYLDVGAEQGHGVRVVYGGRFGMAVADELKGTIHVSVRADEHRALPTTRYGMPSVDRVIEVAPADAVAPSRRVLERLLAERDYPSGEDGRLALATLVAAFVSNESGHKPVTIDSDSLPRDRRFDYA
jgi:predicted dehydrogenase